MPGAPSRHGPAHYSPIPTQHRARWQRSESVALVGPGTGVGSSRAGSGTVRRGQGYERRVTSHGLAAASRRLAYLPGVAVRVISVEVAARIPGVVGPVASGGRVGNGACRKVGMWPGELRTRGGRRQKEASRCPVSLGQRPAPPHLRPCAVRRVASCWISRRRRSRESDTRRTARTTGLKSAPMEPSTPRFPR